MTSPTNRHAMTTVNNLLVTKTTLLRDLQALGITSGMTLLVHTSLSSLGWVCGGEQALVEALQLALGSDGTLVMPAHSAQLSDPAQWQNPPVPQDSWETIRREMPAYDLRLTPTRAMGAVAEFFRRAKGVRRSSHPALSFAARGTHRDNVIDSHSLNDGLGESSPLARLYELDAHILLLGVDHDKNTSLHLAEYRWNGSATRRTTESTPILLDGQRRWVDYDDIDHDSSDFLTIGRAFEATSDFNVGTVGKATAKLLSLPEMVDFAVEWMNDHRPG